MTEDREHADRVDALVARVMDRPGRAITLNLPPYEVGEFVRRLDIALDKVYGDDVFDIAARLVLGSACTTAAKAVDQFVAALQLPYTAARGWGDFMEALADRPSSRGECVVVADASQLLKYEDFDRWRELVQSLRSGPFCMGGGSRTLVLIDDEFMWQDWAFTSMADIARVEA
ncbi:hypothetical protein [Actinomadura rugatobispora]|uniref:Barstar (barnase inhibitor) domain-containing protein n=1 Tax=Actinomadura rugatobispora TaxID=1994 RepID=A0ABW0ZWT8_9ACTN|nr:hypothetical protein GCM10010200_017060 [Actinomadura rugatobispora]